jgi:hypothetical protein
MLYALDKYISFSLLIIFYEKFGVSVAFLMHQSHREQREFRS